MAEERVQRRLAAILAADVVGYSRLMETDEEGTLRRLRSAFHEVVTPVIAEHNGRMVKTTGDGLLAEFMSVVDAVRCAVALQVRQGERDLDLPAEQRLQFRIGINLGDVIIEGGDIFGDGVNVAARLEGLADTGGILLSGTAYDQLKNNVNVGFEYLGQQQVKNIAAPVRVYRVLTDPTVAGKTVSVAEPRLRQRHWVVLTAVLVLVAGTSGVAWWHPWAPAPTPASVERMALPLPDKPSIAVLPFTNMSGDPGQEFFADGMTDDLITDLSKVSSLFVIARNSTFVYKGKAVKISEVAEDLGVHYVLEGSVQRAGDQLRVNAQLVDALTGGHIWADRFEGEIDDIFSVQDLFVHNIAEALKIRLTKGEVEEIGRGKTDNIAAKEAFDEGWSHYLRFNQQDNAAAVDPLMRAIEIDPEYGRAYAALALVYFRYVDYYQYQKSGQGLGNSPDSIYLKGQHYHQLASKYPTALSHVIDAQIYTWHGQAEYAIREAGRAIASDPNEPETHLAMAWALIISAKPDEALNFVDTAIRLNPNYPSHYQLARGIALFAAGDLNQAAQILNEEYERNPQAVALLVPLASMLAQLGHRKEASEVLATWRPGTDQTAFEKIWDEGSEQDLILPFRWKTGYTNLRRRLVDGLRVASLPLDVTVSSLLSELKLDNRIERERIVRQLGWFGPAAAPAVPALIELLGDDVLRGEAVRSLGKIGPAAKAAIPALEALQDEDLIGYYAKEALKEIKNSN